MEAEAYTKNKWRGLKIMFAGVVIAAFGFLLGWFEFRAFGIFLFWVGWLLGVVGMVVHFRQFYREMKADPKDLYPPAKQPWER